MPGRLLVVTGLWPTPDRPSSGIFVKRRLEGVDATVIGPRSFAGPMPLRYLALLWRALTARGRFVAVEAHVLFPAGIVGLLAARLRGIPLVVYAHGADVRDTAQANPAYRWLSRLVARSSTIATNSEATAQLVRRLGGDPVVIPPGVDRERFRAEPRPPARRVLYLGGSEARKAPEIGRLADTLVGPGLRLVDPEDVPQLIAEHDVVLVPSHREPFGLVAAEAICAGRWVVARDVDGLREVVTDGVNGTLVADGNFAGALTRVPDYDPAAVSATGERFDWIHHRERINALVETAVASHRRGGHRATGSDVDCR